MPDKPQVVIDASVAVKWLHEEAKTNKALHLLDKITSGTVVAIVPDLIMYEVTNALVRGIGKPLAEANDAVDLLLEIPWQVIAPAPTILKDAIQLAVNQPKLSIYDAIYVAIASHYEATVITDDQKLHKLVGAPLTRLL